MTTFLKNSNQVFHKVSDVRKKTVHHYLTLTKKQKVSFWTIASVVIFVLLYGTIHKNTEVIAAPDKERNVVVASLLSLSKKKQDIITDLYLKYIM